MAIVYEQTVASMSSSIKRACKMKTICIISVDVEGMPLKGHGMDYSTVTEGIPMLLDLFNEFGIRSTFFVTSDAARDTAGVLREITECKHEIGCHSKGDQDYAYLKEATESINRHLKVTPLGFRAHRHRINGSTLVSLFQLGYKYDSSVVSSSRIFNKEYSSKAPKTPYHPSLNNIYQEGESRLVEIPISSLPMLRLPLGLSYVKLFGLTIYKLFLTKLNYRIVTMYLHPYDLFATPANPDASIDAPLNFRLAQKRRIEGFKVLRGLLAFFTKRFAPTYICAREILNNYDLVSRGGVEPPVSTV